MLNFQDMMNDFYNYEPKEGDVAGQMQKQAFQGNFLQSMLDSNLAQQLGQFNSALAQQNMSHQADLEQRNQSASMKISAELRHAVNGCPVPISEPSC